MTHQPTPSDRLPAALRTEALEQLLTERGLVDPKVMDRFIATYETKVGPLNGAKVVAKAWTDPEYRRRLLDDGTAAIKELGFTGPQGEHIVVVENTATAHNVVVCTLCSCYPWPVLGLPPSWYKDPAYRARVVQGAAQRCSPRWASTWPTTSRSPSATPAARCAGWCCPSAPPAPSELSEEELVPLGHPGRAWSAWRKVRGASDATAATARLASTARPRRRGPTASWSSPSRGRAAPSAWPSRCTRPARSPGRRSRRR